MQQDYPLSRSYYGQTFRASRTAPEGYAEFTELQKLLQQYKRNLGAVGKAVSALKEQLWQQKGSMGEQFSHQQVLADSGRDQLAATEVSHALIDRKRTKSFTTAEAATVGHNCPARPMHARHDKLADASSKLEGPLCRL